MSAIKLQPRPVDIRCRCLAFTIERRTVSRHTVPIIVTGLEWKHIFGLYSPTLAEPDSLPIALLSSKQYAVLSKGAVAQFLDHGYVQPSHVSPTRINMPTGCEPTLVLLVTLRCLSALTHF